MPSKNFSFNFNSNLSVNGKKVFGTSASDKQNLTPQQEYWLNRILRDYGGKIYLLIILFIVLMFAVVYFAGSSKDTSKSIEIHQSANL